MKKLLLILIVAFPVFSFAQNKITLNDGTSFVAEIDAFLGHRLVFVDNVEAINADRIDIEKVTVISGEVSKSRMRAILKKNPAVVFDDAEYTKQDLENYKYNNEEKSEFSPYSKLQSASAFKLTGAVVGFGSLALNYGGAFDDMDPDTRKTVMTVSLATAAVCYFIGEVTLISYNKQTKSDAVTLTGSSHGVGLAINF